MAYDSAITTFTTKTDKVDIVAAAHINAVQAELVTIETILGTNVKGDRADLKTRLNNALDADGSILSGASFPSPALPSQLFFRTDLDVGYLRNAANSAWLSLSLQKSAFKVRITADGTPVTCDETGGFDNNNDFASNQFVAPVTGRYQFNVVIQWTRSASGPGTTFPICYIRVNSSSVHEFQTFPYISAASGTYAGSTAGTVILNLSVSDTVDIVAVTSINNYTVVINDITKSFFSGALLNGS